MRITNDPIVVSGNMSANVVSNTQQLNQIFGYSIQAVWTTLGTLGGTFKLQSSTNYQKDANGNVLNAGNWDDVPNSSLTISAAGSNTWNVADANYPWVRLVYTKTTGDSGTLNATFFGRGF